MMGAVQAGAAWRPLGWDSAHFEYPVARLDIPTTAHAGDVVAACASMIDQGIRLAYWSGLERVPVETLHRIAPEARTRLVDLKTTYAMALRDARPKGGNTPLRLWDESMGLLDLLGIEAGKYSRFATDPWITAPKFAGLYREWTQKSLTKELADEVIVVPGENNTPVGFVTLGNKDGRGDIGLIAVHRDYRGFGYGRALVEAAQRWFLEHGYTHGQVVTQGENRPACRLYEACGYTVERVEYFYHLWFGYGPSTFVGR